MKKFLLAAAAMLIALPAFAQVNNYGTITAASTDCSTAGSCVSLTMNPNAATPDSPCPSCPNASQGTDFVRCFISYNWKPNFCTHGV